VGTAAAEIVAKTWNYAQHAELQLSLALSTELRLKSLSIKKTI